MKFLKSIAPIIVVILLSFWTIKPLFIPGFFPIHDDTQVARVFEMTKSLSDGMFPARWVADLGYGYGYPIFNFYAPLAYYIGAMFQIIGFDALVATKIMMGIGIILSAVFMYLLAKQFWGKLGGIVSALFYVYAPFHAVDIFVRGDVAEFWAYAFIPLTFFGFYKLFKSSGSLKWGIVSSFSYAFLILSHNLTAMMSTPFLALFIIVLVFTSYKKNDIKSIKSLLISFFIGLMLSAFYFIPALAEQKYTNVLSQLGGGADYKDHYVCFTQLWQSQWGFGGSSPGCLDGVSFMIGKVHILVSLVVLILAGVFFKKKGKERNKVILACSLGLVLSVLLMLSISKPLWDHMPLMAFFQYPWRFLLLASFFSSILAGAAVFYSRLIFLNKWIEYLTFLCLVIAIIALNMKFFVPQTIFGKSANDYVNKEILRWETSKISDEYMPKDFPKPVIKSDVASSTVTFSKEEIEIIKQSETSRKIILELNVLKQATLHFNIAYFPSWRLKVDGVSRGSIVSKGYDVTLAKGNHNIEMEFVESIPEIASDLITLSGLTIVIVGIILRKKKVIYG